MKPIKFTFGIAVASLLAFAAQAAPQYGLQNFNNWAQDLENTGTIQVNNNTQAVCTVDYTGGNDATNRPRAELAIHNLVPNGADVSFQFDCFITNQLGGTEAGGCIFQFFAQGDDGSYQAPNFLFKTSGGGTFVGYNNAPFGGSYGPTNINWSAPCLNHWYTFIARIYCMSNDAGFISLWAGPVGHPTNYVGTLWGANTAAHTNGVIVKCGTYSMGAGAYSVGKVTIQNMNVTYNGSNAVNTLGTYELQNVCSGLAMNPGSNETTNGTPLIQWPFYNNANYSWTFIPTTNGYYQMNNVNSGKDANVFGAATTNGAPLIIYPYGSNGNDQWKPVVNSDGSYTFYNLHSGKVLEDPGSSMANGTHMDQWDANGGANQHWFLINIGQ